MEERKDTLSSELGRKEGSEEVKLEVERHKSEGADLGDDSTFSRKCLQTVERVENGRSV